jgi:hypothetical protein
VAEALEHVVPDVPLDLALVPSPDGKGRSPVLIAVVGVHRSTVGDSVARPERLTLVVSAYAADGRPVASRTSQINTTLPPESADVRFDVVTRLDLPPGSYFVRAAIEASNAPRIGSVFGEVVVPPFASRDLLLSGLSLSVSPSPTAGPRSAIDGLPIPTPTVQRTFRASDRVSATVAVSADLRTPLTPVALELQLLGQDGQRISGDIRQLSAPDFISGIARFTFPVNFAGLKPGNYWIAISMKGPNGQLIQRTARIQLQ